MKDNFNEIRFPEDIAFGSSGGPAFNTNITQSINGNENRSIIWNSAISRYTVIHSLKTQQQIDELISFFRIHYGQAIGFRFKDWVDYQVQKTPMHYTGGDSYKLVKHYTYDNVTSIRAIAKPVQDTVKIYNSTGEKDITKHFSIDYTSGVVVGSAPDGKNPVASFEFDVPVRFANDHLEIKSEERQHFFSADKITLMEIRV